ncbi:SMI1/KNR4 family protein [Bacillus sp. T33-2]|uniref:SMI1/KNR4 family protein n=1 Tax=Bacillus sp. T33-2 TaxID=2054168 RepID=UPI000C788CD6|nr:SMI1/KNR4 family protein [Bacillus sp. T33-2]PLR90022.1 hypothetical protein CVD19_22880 [Bacillus sp. T33-2]
MGSRLVHKTLQGLKKRLDTNNQLIISGRAGALSNAICKFNPPAMIDAITDFENLTNFMLPEDHKEFLLQHNGSTIFDIIIDNNIHAGGGLDIFSLEKIKQSLNDLSLLPSNYLPIAHLLDGHYLVVDRKCLEENDPNYLSITNFLETTRLNLNFEIFLDRYIVAQGNIFWSWPIYTAKNYYRTHND